MTVIAVVTKDRLVSWEMKSIWRAAKKRGLAIEWIDPTSWSADLCHRQVWFAKKDPVSPLRVLGRVDAPCVWDGIKVLTILETFGCPILNDATTFLRGRNKEITSATLAAAGVNHPQSWVLTQPTAYKRLTSLSFPLVYKPSCGSKGDGVRLLANEGALKQLIRKCPPPYYVQQYIGDVLEELRVIVIGSEVIGAVRKRKRPGEWRGNLALGANAQPVPPTGPVVSAALSAAKAVGAGFAGIDILVTSEGPVVIEVNVCPQFQGFVQATGIDVADRVLSHLLALPAPEV